jgi:hypothetical protein
VSDEWRPSARSGLWWSVLGLILVGAGLIVFAIPVFGPRTRVSIPIGPIEVVVVVGLTLLLALAHEGIHGAAMSRFGAKPKFGATVVAAVMPALYTTAPGHLFTRAQYLVIALAPGIAISIVGFAACFSPIGPYLVVPLALHLGGCTGDAIASIRVLREAPGTLFEDLRDGIRFHRGVSIT